MPDPKDRNPIAWRKSRSGAWASRGFHYQHLITSLILVRQWAGLAPTGFLVPEGLEDCVFEANKLEILIQIKSRKDEKFGATEVQKFLSTLEEKAAEIDTNGKIRVAIVLEQPCSGREGISIDQLFNKEEENVLVCAKPDDGIIGLLSNHLDIAEVVADGIASDLYKLVAQVSQENASLSFKNRRRISTTEVESRILERLESGDLSAIDHALALSLLEPVDFTTRIDEPSFYLGVKVKPGHVVAGLVLERTDDVNEVVQTLMQRRHVLISGPSGAGKSALMWLSANALCRDLRWFQITGKAAAADADTVVRFIRARRPSKSSPIGIAFDEVGSSNSDLWDVLVRELRGLSGVYLLGSVRNEDVNLIANQSDTQFIEVHLDESLAKMVWEILAAGNQTSWVHWREPFEQSDGLMLEYVHLLTKGKRLADVIEEQVREREQENRHDELAIIRCSAVLCARDGEIDAKKLFQLLEIRSDAASHALKRLIDEHLVCEKRPGVIGGLHMLRSAALSQASHDGAVFLTEDSLWRSLPSATVETQPRIVQSILATAQGEAETVALRNLAETLAANPDLELWVSILTGLGLATLERRVASFMTILEQHEVQRAQWSLASMFTDPDINIPDLSEFDQWQRLRDAVLEFRAVSKDDLRPACLEQLPDGSRVPSCRNLREANKLLSCLAPICGGEPVRLKLETNFTGDGEHDIRQVASLLSTAHLIDPNMSESIVESLGGEEVLFEWFDSQTPWVTSPEIEEEGNHGRTVRSNMFYVAEQYQHDPHETVCRICETLIAISPRSDAAASDAVDPLGRVIEIGEFVPWSKNMPRQNIPAKVRVAWNVAFRQILLARSAADSLTGYAQQIALLVHRTEKVFRSFTEKWIRGRSIPNAEALAVEINEIVGSVNALKYAAPEKPQPSMTAPALGDGADDNLGALLTGVLGNLLPRLNKIPGEERPKGAASFAGDLAAQAEEHLRSDVWRMSSSPPLHELAELGERIGNLSCVLHEMAHDYSATAIQRIVKAARKGTLGKAINAAARFCRSHAERRFQVRLSTIENELEELGWSAQCWVRPIEERDCVYWPAREIAIVVKISDFGTQTQYADDCLEIGRRIFKNDWPYTVVPAINEKVLASFAVLPSSHVPLPDQDFSSKWRCFINEDFLSSEVVKYFDRALEQCIQLSAIITSRGIEKLHSEEDEAFAKTIESFEQNYAFVREAAERTGMEHLEWACDFLERNWNHVADEFESTKAGRKNAEPLCMSPHLAMSGEIDERALEIAAARLLIMQEECSIMAKCNGNSA